MKLRYVASNDPVYKYVHLIGYIELQAIHAWVSCTRESLSMLSTYIILFSLYLTAR